MKLEINGIRKHYRRREVLLGASLTAQSGQCIGILGQNGCGKSTFLSILAGTLRSDEGEFLVFEADDTQDCTQDSHSAFVPKDLLKSPSLRSRLTGYVPQTTPLMEELSALDNLRLWYPDRKTLKEELQGGVLKKLGVDEFLHTPVSKLSGGMKKRLSIGCSVAHHPQILLLDEPGAALDLVCKEIIVDYLHDFCSEGGIAVMASHEIHEITSCDATYILKGGVLVPYLFDGDVEKLVNHL